MDAFNDELLKTLPAMRAFAMQLCRNRSRADDLVQDAAVRMLGRAEQFTIGTNFKAWAFTIVRHIFIDSCRSERRAGVSEPIDDDICGTAPVQEDGVLAGEVQRCLGQLCTKHREVLQLVVGQDLSYETTAEVLQIPVGTVRSRLSRARRELERKIMGGEERITWNGSADLSRGLVPCSRN